MSTAESTGVLRELKFTTLQNMIVTMTDWQRQNLIGAYYDFHPAGEKNVRTFDVYLKVIDINLSVARKGEYTTLIRFLSDHGLTFLLQGISYTTKPQRLPQNGYALEPMPKGTESYRAFLRDELNELNINPDPDRGLYTTLYPEDLGEWRCAYHHLPVRHDR